MRVSTISHILNCPYSLTLEADLSNRVTVSLSSRTKVLRPVVNEWQEVDLPSRQLEYNLATGVALSATVLKKSQMWLEQIRAFLVRDRLVVVSEQFNGFVVVASPGVVPADTVLALVSELLTGRSRQETQKLELWVGHVVADSVALWILAEPVADL